MRKKILGFLHFSTDLGDGVRTGVVFSDCTERCNKICSSFSFIPDHKFCEDTPEKNEYTPKELADYLKEEKAMYYAKKLGISFLGREPFRDPFFCAEVAKELKKADINLQIHTCGMCSMVAFEYLDGLVDQYLLRVFLADNNSDFYQQERLRQVVSFLESHKTSYRIQLLISDSGLLSEAKAFAEFILKLQYFKSVLLEFSNSDISEEDHKRYRQIFLNKKIPLY